MQDRGFSVSVLAELLNLNLEGSKDIHISKISPLHSPEEGSLVFITQKDFDKKVFEVASAFLVDEALRSEIPLLKDKSCFFTTKPKESFIRLLQIFERKGSDEEDILTIEECKKLFPDAFISVRAMVERGVKIGKGSRILAGAYIGKSVVIGDKVTVSNNASILHGTRIGSNCFIGSGSVLGGDGFGYEMVGSDVIKIPQIGSVILEENVEIGVNSCIDRATVGYTRIGAFTKVDNLVQIAHNVQIGAKCFIAAQVGISGSTVVGNGVFFGGQAGVGDHVVIGDFSQVGPQCGVPSYKKFPMKSRLLGTPALDALEFARITMSMRRLPNLLKNKR